jgi:subfamily B ATP-binding cassette protein MsbA
MIINRISGLVLPYSTRFLIDNVIVKHQLQMLKPLVLGVLAATMIQGITSFSLTQLLSKEAQRLIAELRQRVQAHIGWLPVSFHDSTKSGALVSRIMNDVEGVRNLIGTGLVDLVGGLMTAVIALVVLFRISALMTGLAFGFVLCFGAALFKAFGTIRPIFRERGKINAEVTGRLAESLGGVRVVKGYHAEEREENVFSHGVQRLLDNVLRTLTATSAMSLSASLSGGGDHHVCGRAANRGGHAHHRRIFYLHTFSWISRGSRHADRSDWHSDYRSSGRPGAYSRDSV